MKMGEGILYFSQLKRCESERNEENFCAFAHGKKLAFMKEGKL